MGRRRELPSAKGAADADHWSWAQELAGLGDNQNRDVAEDVGEDGDDEDPDEDFARLLDPEARALLEGIHVERAMEELECDGLESLASDAESSGGAR